MGRVASIAALLVVGATASAALFTPMPSTEPTRPTPMKMSSPAQAATPAIEAGRPPPVPLSRLPPLPAPEVAPLTGPPSELSHVQPAKRDAEIAKPVDRSLTSNARCGGRTLTSVRVEPDGTVHIQC
jgi:hypothetical protein